MSDTTPLRRNVPFWILVGGSVVSLGSGAFILVDRLASMTTALNAQTATGVDVYVGQIQAVLGAILIGAGVVGLALALVTASIRVLFARPAVESVAVDVVEDSEDGDAVQADEDSDADSTVEADALGYDEELGYSEGDRAAEDDLTPSTR